MRPIAYLGIGLAVATAATAGAFYLVLTEKRDLGATVDQLAVALQKAKGQAITQRRFVNRFCSTFGLPLESTVEVAGEALEHVAFVYRAARHHAPDATDSNCTALRELASLDVRAEKHASPAP